MAFTAGYKVNENTQFEFTVSNETIHEMVQAEGGITDSDLVDYCYSALIDSRVYRIFPEMHVTSMDADWGSTVASQYYAHMAGGPNLTNVKPTFNKDLLNDTDQAYQRNFLVWEGTIYPNTEQAKTGTFLVMDVKNLHNFYVDFSNAGFGTGSVASSDYSQTYPEYGWPGYTGPVYTYIGNSLVHSTIMTNNNDPQLNPDHNLFVINVMIFNDQLAIAEMNPSTHGNSNIGSEGIAYAPFSDEWLNRGGGYLNWDDPQRHYQGVTGSWGAIGDYRNAYDYPGAPSDEIGSLSFLSYVPLGNDDMLLELSGQWGQQNYASGLGITYGGLTTSKSTILKWQSWCGLLFKYEDVFYKPIIQQGVVVGYSDDMDAESEYDDMTNVTGNNISPTPPVPPAPPYPDDDDWDSLDRGPVGVGGAGLLKVYAMSLAELADFSSWMNSVDSGSGYDGPPEGFNVIDSIIGLSQYPVNFQGGTGTTLVFTNSAAKPNERVINSHCNAHRLTGVGTTQHWYLGSITIDKKFSNDTAFLDYDTLLEVYIPFCGIFPIDTQMVMGRTISGDIWVDPVTGGCYAEIDCSTDQGGVAPIVMAEGNIGIEMPITSTQYSMAKAAQATNVHSFVAGAIGTALGAAIGAAVGGAVTSAAANGFSSVGHMVKTLGPGGSAAQVSAGMSADFTNMVRGLGTGASMGAGAGLVGKATKESYNVFRTNKMLQAANNTAVKGSLSSSFASWAQPWQAYIKITRYNKQVPGNYASTVGLPVVDNKTIGNYADGEFLVAVNPNVSGISEATAEELSIIYNALTSGVYV